MPLLLWNTYIRLHSLHKSFQHTFSPSKLGPSFTAGIQLLSLTLLLPDTYTATTSTQNSPPPLGISLIFTHCITSQFPVTSYLILCCSEPFFLQLPLVFSECRILLLTKFDHNYHFLYQDLIFAPPGAHLLIKWTKTLPHQKAHHWFQLPTIQNHYAQLEPLNPSFNQGHSHHQLPCLQTFSNHTHRSLILIYEMH